MLQSVHTSSLANDRDFGVFVTQGTQSRAVLDKLFAERPRCGLSPHPHLSPEPLRLAQPGSSPPHTSPATTQSLPEEHVGPLLIFFQPQLEPCTRALWAPSCNFHRGPGPVPTEGLFCVPALSKAPVPAPEAGCSHPSNGPSP